MAIDPNIFDRYVGTYRIGPYELITVSRAAERFYAQLPGQPKFLVFAETDRDFFFKMPDAQLTFEVDRGDQQGVAARVTIHQNGETGWQSAWARTKWSKPWMKFGFTTRLLRSDD